MKTSHVEILAPAGSFESLRSAINAGCDSVFFGIADFNMRATAANNFSFEDLKEIRSICSNNNVKSYITLNTLMYNEDLDMMRRVVDAVKVNNIDAVIAADMAAINYARENDVDAHISTQLSISNIESLKFYSQFTDRVVLARELNLLQMREIYDQIIEQDIRGPKGELVELEVFAHGALCVAVSGRCGMSLHCSGSSANRGKCSQVCRKKFKVVEMESEQELIVDNNYVMSSADLCTIGMLPELVHAGAKVLKFEGRGRSPEYVDTVIRTYKEALQSIEKGEYTDENINKWNESLGTVFHRGFSKGMYMGRQFVEWAGTHGSKASMEKIQLGTVVKYYPNIEVAEVKIEAKEEINEGEEILIIGSKTGVVKQKILNMQIEEDTVKKAKQGDEITFKIKSKVKAGDKFFVFRRRADSLPRGRELLLQQI